MRDVDRSDPVRPDTPFAVDGLIQTIIASLAPPCRCGPISVRCTSREKAMPAADSCGSATPRKIMRRRTK